MSDKLKKFSLSKEKMENIKGASHPLNGADFWPLAKVAFRGKKNDKNTNHDNCH